MAHDTQPPAPTAPTALTLDDAIKLIQASFAAASGSQADRLASAVEALQANAPKRKIRIGEYWPGGPFHPTREGAVKFLRPYLINGLPPNWETTFDAEARLLNQIDRSGRYLDRIVEVILRDEGVDEMVEIRWNCKSNDQRNALQSKIVHTADSKSTFEDLLRMIVAAQQAEEAAMIEAGLPGPSKRSAGQSAAFRDATQRRDAREAREAKTT